MSENAAGGVPVIRDVYPYLCVRDAAAAIEFYSGVFGAEELLRLTSLDGRIARSRLKKSSGDLRRNSGLNSRSRIPAPEAPKPAITNDRRYFRQFPQSNPNTGGKPTTTIAAQTEYAGR